MSNIGIVKTATKTPVTQTWIENNQEKNTLLYYSRICRHLQTISMPRTFWRVYDRRQKIP